MRSPRNARNHQRTDQGEKKKAVHFGAVTTLSRWRNPPDERRFDSIALKLISPERYTISNRSICWEMRSALDIVSQIPATNISAIASAVVATVPDPAIFGSGRNLAAWIGLVPRQNSSGGKERLGSITKAGHGYLRQMLIVGAMAVVRYAERNGARRPWLVQLLARRKAKVAAVALANKNARVIWAMMNSGERYREPQAA